MFKITNVSGSHLSVEGQHLAPYGSVNISAVTVMTEYLRGRGAIKVERVPDIEPPKVDPRPASTPKPVRPRMDAPAVGTGAS